MNSDLNVNNCTQGFQCPQKWTDLDSTDNETVRFCQDCEQFVFLCQSPEELEFHAKRLHCIAYADKPRALNEPEWMWMGQCLPPQYAGPTMSIWLEPTYNLRQRQLIYLSNLLRVEVSEPHLRHMFCDGQSHCLVKNIHPDMAERLSKRLEEEHISHKLSIDPD
jgi:hypothetical protein